MRLSTPFSRAWVVLIVTFSLLGGASGILTGGAFGAAPAHAVTAGQPVIVVGAGAPDLEVYAARELQRYLFRLTGTLPDLVDDTVVSADPAFVVGTPDTNRVLAAMVAAGQLQVTPHDPGPQGYALKRAVVNGRDLLAIAGSDSNGALYGTYGLLTDYYGVGFGLTGDVFPPGHRALALVNVDERKKPRQEVRGILPWTNFPQGATSYSRNDYAFIIDQLAKMRMNLLNLHNYTGVVGHNEMFVDFTHNGVESRPFMATSETGHAWGMPGWNLDNYRFGAADIFDDYASGSELGLHNDTLDVPDVFGKGRALFQWILRYAHSRGVRVALGIDLDSVPADYGERFDAPGVAEARATELAADYPDLDYLLAYRSEVGSAGDTAAWKATFATFRSAFAARGAPTRFGVSGWGLDPAFVAGLPPDVIAAPLSAYSASFPSGAGFGHREYWGTPWLERDFNSSLYYEPYNMHLSDTIAAYRAAAPNMTGFQALTWRLGGAVDPKVMYVAQAPWVALNRYPDSRSVYLDYAISRFGAAAGPRVAPIIDQNETVASLASECCVNVAPPLSGRDRSADRAKALGQIATVDAAIAATADPAQRARLAEVRARLDSELRYVNIDQRLPTATLQNLADDYRAWVLDFLAQVNDVSSMGNIVSTQNRYVQGQYARREAALTRAFPVLAPVNVVARGTASGAVVTWQTQEPGATRYDVFRDGVKVGQAPGSALRYEDHTSSGRHRYEVTAMVGGVSSPRSVADTVATGAADHTPPKVIVVSAPSSVVSGASLDLLARLVDSRDPSELTATLNYRPFGQASWTALSMEWKARAVFGARIPAANLTGGGVEYFVSASDGVNIGLFPVTGADGPATAIVAPAPAAATLAPPDEVAVSGHDISWQPSGSSVFIRLYRSHSEQSSPSPADMLTELAGTTTHFTDGGADRDGEPLAGRYAYQLTSVDAYGRESPPTAPVVLDFGTGSRTYTANSAEFTGAKVVSAWKPTAYGHAVIGYLGAPRDQVLWPVTAVADAISIRYSNANPAVSRASLLIDGRPAGEVTFPSTGSWDSLRTLTVLRHVEHSVLLRFTPADAAANGPYCCDIESVTLAPQTEVGYEAESGAVTAAAVEADPQASDGATVANVGAVAGSGVAWSGVAGGTAIGIRYAAAASRPTQIGLYVNGSRVDTVLLDGTGGQHTYRTVWRPVAMGVPAGASVELRTDAPDVAANGGAPCTIDSIILGRAGGGGDASTMGRTGGRVVDQSEASGGRTVGYFGARVGDSLSAPVIGLAVGASVSFATPTKGASTLGVYRDQTRVATLTMHSTGSWAAYQTATVLVPLSGTFSLRADRSDVARNAGFCCNIDRVLLLEAGAPSVEAESGTGQGTIVYPDVAASGGQAVGWMGEQVGDRLRWDGMVGDGLTLRYSNGNARGVQASLVVGGLKVGSLVFPPTGGWHKYRLITLAVPLTGWVEVTYSAGDVRANGGRYGANLDMVDAR
jgi:hypothetical protein